MIANDNQDDNAPFTFDPNARDLVQDYLDAAQILEWNAVNYPGLNENPVWLEMVDRFHLEMTAAIDACADDAA